MTQRIRTLFITSVRKHVALTFFLALYLAGQPFTLSGQPRPASSGSDAVTVNETGKKGKYVYSARQGSTEIAAGEIGINLHKMSTKKFFTYSIELKMKDFPFLEEPPIKVEYDIYHFGDDELKKKLQGDGDIYKAIREEVKFFTEETADLLVRNKGFYEVCSTENTDCLKNKINEIVARISGKKIDASTDVSKIKLSSAQKEQVLTEINNTIDEKEKIIDDEYEEIADDFTEDTLEIISEYYETSASDQLEESGMSSNTLRRTTAMALVIVGKATFNILWRGVKIIGIDIPDKIKSAYKACKEIVVAVNELIKLANVWSELSEKEDAFQVYFQALKGFERTRTAPDGTAQQRMSSSLESLIQDTENAYEDYEKTVKLVSSKGMDRKIEEINKKMGNIIQSSASGMDPVEITDTDEYKTIMNMINREEYITLKQFKGNLEAADDSLWNFAQTYKKEYLIEINSKNNLLRSLARAESRDLGRSSRGERVKDWLKRKRNIIENAWSKIEQGAEIFETIQGDEED